MLSEFVDCADVVVVQRRSNARFALESLQRRRIVAQLFRQELQSDAAAQLQILGTVHHTHAAPANDAQHAVMRDRSAGQRSRFRPCAHRSAIVATGNLAARGLVSGGRLPFDWHHEPIAPARHRLDVLGLGNRVAKCFSQLVYRCVDAVLELHDGVVRPKSFLISSRLTRAPSFSTRMRNTWSGCSWSKTAVLPERNSPAFRSRLKEPKRAHFGSVCSIGM